MQCLYTYMYYCWHWWINTDTISTTSTLRHINLKWNVSMTTVESIFIRYRWKRNQCKKALLQITYMYLNLLEWCLTTVKWHPYDTTSCLGQNKILESKKNLQGCLKIRYCMYTQLLYLYTCKCFPLYNTVYTISCYFCITSFWVKSSK